MSEYPLPQPGERQVPLEQLKQNWPDKAKPFVAHFTEADFPGG